MEIRPLSPHVGAEVIGVDISQPLPDDLFKTIDHAYNHYSVLVFRGQKLTPEQQIAFSRLFGELEVSPRTQFALPGHPEILVLSNIIIDGKPIGNADAGRTWHTDMSYMSQVAYANVLYAIEVPVRDGKALGPTQFQNMYMAYADLPPDFKEQYRDATVTFDFEKFNNYMITVKGSQRGKTTSEQRAKRPPAKHPMFLRHPITAQYSLYANPGYAIAVDGLTETESDAVLDFLFEHQLQSKYSYTFDWTVGDVLMWDNLATIHQAVDDYRPDERRHMRRCRIKADPAVAQVRA